MTKTGPVADAGPPEWWARREWIVLALGLAFVGTFTFRYLLLRAFPYPPSGDAGGDLYLAHAWLGHGIVQLSQSLQTPPLYFFAIVIPFTTMFPTFQGIQLYMAFVPALLVFPGYLFVRESGAGRWASVFGATLLAMSTIWSLMVTWNAAYNLFGIFLLLFFLVFLARFLRAPTLRAGIYLGVSFALVGLAHPLTYLVAAIVLATAGVELLWTVGPGRLRRLGLLAAPAIAFSLPLAVFYAPSASGVSTGGGGGSFLSQIFWAFQNGPFFAWGYQGVDLDVVLALDLGLSFLALAAVGVRPDARPFTVGLAGVLVAAVAVELADPANAVRGIYFLPIPFLAPLPALLEGWYHQGFAPAPTSPAPDIGPSTDPLRSPRYRWPGILERTLFVSIAAVVLLVNANVSIGVMNAGIQYNESLRPSAVAAMDWIREHTSPNATFIDGANLEPWMWGYAERMDYAPVPLGIEVTSQSAGWALLADRVDLGSFLLSDPYWVVSASYPSPVGAPQIYLATPGYWEPFLGSQSDSDQIEVLGPSGPEWLGMQYATLASTASRGNGEDLTYSFNLTWQSLGVSVGATTALSGSGFSLGWSGLNCAVLQANYTFGIPPSGYFFGYESVPVVNNASSLSDRFTFNGETFRLDLSGGRFTQRTLADGWTQLWYWGNRTLSATTSGMAPQNTEPSLALNTSALLHQLAVNYAIVDIDRDFGMYERLRAGVFWSGPAVLLYQNGNVVVYGQ
jgi:hypothetical protein